MPSGKQFHSVAALASALGVALAPLPAAAQGKDVGLTYRCVGKDGKKYYGQTLPQECLGQPVEMLNARGRVVRRFDAQADAQARAAKEAEQKKKAEEAALAKEEERRTRALLATYSSEKDVDHARARALEENKAAVHMVEARIAEIKKRQVRNAKELEFYTGKNKPPARLEQDIHDAEVDLKAQEGLLAAKKKEVDAINAKYDEDKRRYLELTRRK
jgi:hypothetical protein